jgi:hypothetical protein
MAHGIASLNLACQELNPDRDEIQMNLNLLNSCTEVSKNKRSRKGKEDEAQQGLQKGTLRAQKTVPEPEEVDRKRRGKSVIGGWQLRTDRRKELRSSQKLIDNSSGALIIWKLVN